MARWTSFNTRITASVRTTNRMNALLNESMLSQKKYPILKQYEKDLTLNEDIEIQEQRKSKIKIEFLRNNFSMEFVHKIVSEIIEERLAWDRFNRTYDSWKSAQLAESLARKIRDRVKQLNYRRFGSTLGLQFCNDEDTDIIYTSLCAL